jgi:hypothetical protein
MFVTATVAKRIERAESEVVRAAANASAVRVGADQMVLRDIAGGIAVFVENGCPFNKVAGLGFGGVPAAGELDALEREFSRRGAAVRVEISTLADPAVAGAFVRRGYQLAGFENVLGCDLSSSPARQGSNREVAVRLAEGADADAWLVTVLEGFLHLDTFDGPPPTETFAREALEPVVGDMRRNTSLEKYLGRIDGVAAGGGALQVSGTVAILCGAATLPAFRRRGVQSALLAERLQLASARGCEIAVVTTEPGSKSQANVQRAGFALLYARAVLVKEA